MKFAVRRPIKIVMLGAGGTGAYIARDLYRLLYALDRPCRFIIADGDLCEEKNLIRQNFTPADLGQNKAQVVATRYSSVFGLETEYIPEFIEYEDRLMELVRTELFPDPNYTYSWGDKKVKELVILIGAVDNNKSRQLCHNVFLECQDLVYIDAGNGVLNGQVVCGVRRAGRTMAQPVGTLYPDILEAKDKFPTELSCAEASVSAPQSIMANIMAASSVLCVLYNIMTSGENIIRKATFSTKSGFVRTEVEQVKAA